MNDYRAYEKIFVFDNELLLDGSSINDEFYSRSFWKKGNRRFGKYKFLEPSHMHLSETKTFSD